MLQSLVDGDKDENNPNLIRVNITKAYEMALKKYHGWFVQKLFKVSFFKNNEINTHLEVQILNKIFYYIKKLFLYK